jgi:glucosamine--fructose-6-phosphate aminotransferase (isomerizing)
MLEHAKGNYKHWMIKEINEQPAIIRRLLKGRVNLATSTLTAHAFDYIKQHHYDYRVLVGCGTSYHSAMLARYWFDEGCDAHFAVVIASEYKYRPRKNLDQTLHLFTSQS